MFSDAFQKYPSDKYSPIFRTVEESDGNINSLPAFKVDRLPDKRDYDNRAYRIDE